MKFYFLLFVNLSLLTNCKKYKPAEPAFFIQTQEPKVLTSATFTQGSGSNKITDYFLYVDGQFQGVYPVGSLMPIVNKNKNVTINVFAGILNNGIRDTRVPYPAYDYFSLDTFVNAGTTIKRPFTFIYSSGVKFEWVEGFEPGSGSGVTIKKSPQSDINFRYASAADSYEGRSLELNLRDSLVAQVETSISYELPSGSPSVYLELNYKCTAPFSVGLIGDADVKSVLVINPQANWNKIYILLSNSVSTPPVSEKYKVYFRMLNTSDHPNPVLFLDNLKLIHF